MSAETQIPIAKSESWKMFNTISGKYDFLNKCLSLGLDASWRAKMGDLLPQDKNIHVLDLATGTADVLINLVKQNKMIQGNGIDLADKMLNLGRDKIHKQGLSGRIVLSNGDAQDIPFEDKKFDAVTIAFGIRNMPNTVLALKEMARVLKDDGDALILEFSVPRNPIIRIFFLAYLKIIVPLVGGLLSGNFKAYYYLNKTIEGFYHGESFCQLMRQVGFTNIKEHRLLFGTATIYHGKLK